MKRFLFLVLLTGCVTTDTGVIPMGPDTFMIAGTSATGAGAYGEVLGHLYKAANEHCGAMKKKLLPISTEGRDGRVGSNYASAKLEFRCLDAGDHELRRPTLAPVPNTVIEDRRK